MRGLRETTGPRAREARRGLREVEPSPPAAGEPPAPSTRRQRTSEPEAKAGTLPPPHLAFKKRLDTPVAVSGPTLEAAAAQSGTDGSESSSSESGARGSSGPQTAKARARRRQRRYWRQDAPGSELSVSVLEEKATSLEVKADYKKRVLKFLGFCKEKAMELAPGAAIGAALGSCGRLYSAYREVRCR